MTIKSKSITNPDIQLWRGGSMTLLNLESYVIRDLKNLVAMLTDPLADEDTWNRALTRITKIVISDLEQINDEYAELKRRRGGRPRKD